MDYIRFSNQSVKARMGWIQQVLNLPITYKKDKGTVKALVKFQKDHGLSGNGVVCEKTYELLYSCGGSSVRMSK